MNSFDSIKTVGIQTGVESFEKGLHGSFHEEFFWFLNESGFWGEEPPELVAYDTHNELMAAVESGEIGTVIAADDTAHGGPVQTSREAIENHGVLNGSTKLIGSGVINIAMMALYHPDTPMDKVQHLYSQLPAREQGRDYVEKHGYGEMDCSDTLLAAYHVSQGKGWVRNELGILSPVAALGSKLAGESAELEIGDQVSKKGNATKFNVWSNEVDPDETAEYMTISFNVPNTRAQLKKSTGIISQELDYNIVHIDNAPSKTDSDMMAFLAEIERDGKDPQKLVSMLGEIGVDSSLIGVYNKYTNLSPEDLTPMSSVTVDHSEWEKPEWANPVNGSNAYYVAPEEINHPAVLDDILTCLDHTNIEILSRPPLPLGNSFRRGFYLVTEERDEDSREHALERFGYAKLPVTDLVYRDRGLHERTEVVTI